MSKKNNVNPGQYKVAGRDRQGEDIVQQEHRQNYAQNKADERAAAHSEEQQAAERATASTKNKR